jgi:phospholipid/cholesterol/gamma-HCH transport system permease protein
MSPRRGVRPALWKRFLHRLGAPLHEQISIGLEIIILFYRVIKRVFRRKSWRRAEICQSIVYTGISSLPIIVASTSFAGIVITHELAWHMNYALHTVTMIPGFAGQFILRELGIAIPALLLVAKVGAATTAEIGTMKVTEQIDALRLLRIDPIDYLVFPRFIAAIVSGACLTLISVAVTLLCAICISVIHYNFSVLEFMTALGHFVSLSDLVCALVKGVIYGSVIPIISCVYGFRCKGGAQGVGLATTNSVVSSTIAVIILDFVLTYFFTLIL